MRSATNTRNQATVRLQAIIFLIYLSYFLMKDMGAFFGEASPERCVASGSSGDEMLTPKILLISNQQNVSPWSIVGQVKQRLQVVLLRQPGLAVEWWAEETPDIILFDHDPAEPSVIDLIRELREQAVVPILLLSSERADKFILEAYKAGVDEYILKPIPPALLQAKVRSWLRRSWSIPVDMLDSLKVGEVQFLPSERSIVLDDQTPIRLTNLELRLMFYLMSHAGRTVTAEELCHRVWGSYAEGKKTTLKNVVYRLRMKIEMDPAHPHYILTVSGVGYQFTPQ
jgi:DNA-binding response OmpR family regulator